MARLDRLKIASIAFAIIWTCGMILWSGSFELASIILLTAGGCFGGTLWYIGMRWFFRRLGHPLEEK